jgi:hypothetical protein
MSLQSADLPSDGQWRTFLDSVQQQSDIRLTPPCSDKATLLRNETATLLGADGYYHIRMKKNFALRPHNVVAGYQSKRFKELLPGARYHGEQYLFVADSNEATIYDLYSNNSIAGFSSSFSLPVQHIPVVNGAVEFWVRKGVFHSDPATMIPVDIDKD